MDRDYLIFHLCGPMASWGNIAAGSYRSTDDHPTKSAVIGILCAALGIEREDQEKQSLLTDAYDMICVSACNSTLVVDYHTTASNSVEGATNRNEEINGILGDRKVEGKKNTILSNRDYICNGYYTIFISDRGTAAYSLKDLKDALGRPKYTLYLGRKSCPVSMPVVADIKTFGSMKEAIVSERFKPFIDNGMISDVSKSRVFSTYESNDRSMNVIQTILRRDEPGNRSNWTFVPRNEYELTIGDHQ